MHNPAIHTTDGEGRAFARRMLAGFSLIELMIVVVILGALVAIIIPQFNTSESEAKQASDDASQYGTLRQVSNFRSINGVYPSRLHTGSETEDSLTVMGTADGVPDLTELAATNFTHHSQWLALSEEQAKSLASAGIVRLAYGGFDGGSGTAPAVFSETADGIHVAAITETVTTDWEGEDGEVTINGVKLADYIYADPYDAANSVSDGIVVPLFAAPTADWDNYYLGGVEAKYPSKVGVAQVGACPWLEAGASFRYYICYFKVYNNGDPAKLIGTSCPECGPLNP
jgi:prepilin-type N-terminal cleavage/methylation domain-containing protein